MLEQLLQTATSVIEFLLLNTLYAIFLAVLVVLIKLVYPRLPKRVEYGMWCVVLIRLVLPNDLSFDYAISSQIKNWLFSFQDSKLVAELLTNHSLSQSPLVEESTITGNLTITETLFIVWSLIVFVVLSAYIWLRVKLFRMLNKAQPIVEYSIVACANKWRLNFWIKKPVHVIAEEKYLSPFTFYSKNPIIFIPRKILQSQNERLIESIIAHEMAHVKRLDSLWLIFQNVVQILYFFNPMVWFIVKRLSELRESLCDEMVLSTSQLTPTTYGKSLLDVLRFNISGELPVQLSNAFLGYKSQIKQRIAAIGRFSQKQRRPKLELCYVAAFAVLFLPFAEQKINEISINDNAIVEQESPFPESVRRQVQLPKIDHLKKPNENTDN